MLKHFYLLLISVFYGPMQSKRTAFTAGENLNRNQRQYICTAGVKLHYFFTLVAPYQMRNKNYRLTKHPPPPTPLRFNSTFHIVSKFTYHKIPNLPTTHFPIYAQVTHSRPGRRISHGYNPASFVAIRIGP